MTAKKHWILSGQALGVLFLQVKMTLSSEMPMRKEEKKLTVMQASLSINLESIDLYRNPFVKQMDYFK